jgi:hypothetical protein
MNWGSMKAQANMVANATESRIRRPGSSLGSVVCEVVAEGRFTAGEGNVLPNSRSAERRAGLRVSGTARSANVNVAAAVRIDTPSATS